VLDRRRDRAGEDAGTWFRCEDVAVVACGSMHVAGSSMLMVVRLLLL
jgi:hypothetical protein